MFNMRNQIDKIIITAMDRFVWFILLVVMSHLVTEFTRVTGYARGNRNDVVLLNDSLIPHMPVQSMVLFPGQDYGLYEHPNPYSSNPNRYDTNNNNNNNNNIYFNPFQQLQQQQQQQSNAEIFAAPANAQQNGGFSFRPLIDSIFEIPISTLRAVNNLMARLTGSYQQALPRTNGAIVVQKSMAPMGVRAHGFLPSSSSNAAAVASVAADVGKLTLKTAKKSLLREESA